MDTTDAAAFLDPTFWAALCPHLAAACSAPSDCLAAAPPAALATALLPPLLEHGFARAPARALWGEEHAPAARAMCAALSDGISLLRDAGFPATCIILYDEAWGSLARTHQRHAPGGNVWVGQREGRQRAKVPRATHS